MDNNVDREGDLDPLYGMCKTDSIRRKISLARETINSI